MTALSSVERARRGGQVTFQRHGTPHMSATLYGGMVIVASRYFGGDVATMMQYLRNFKRNPEQVQAVAYDAT